MVLLLNRSKKLYNIGPSCFHFFVVKYISAARYGATTHRPMTLVTVTFSVTRKNVTLSITVLDAYTDHCIIDLLFDLFGIVCFTNKNKIVNCDTADSKPVKQEVNGTAIVSPLVFPD